MDEDGRGDEANREQDEGGADDSHSALESRLEPEHHLGK